MVVASSVAVSAASASNAQPSFETSRHAASSRTVAARPAPGAGPSSASARDAPAAARRRLPSPDRWRHRQFPRREPPKRDPRVFALRLGVAERVHQRIARERRRERGVPAVPAGRRLGNRTTPAASTRRARGTTPRRVLDARSDAFDPRRRGRFVVVVIARRLTTCVRASARRGAPAPQVRGHLREALKRLVVDGVAPAGAHRARAPVLPPRQVRQDLLLQRRGKLVRGQRFSAGPRARGPRRPRTRRRWSPDDTSASPSSPPSSPPPSSACRRATPSDPPRTTPRRAWRGRKA